MSVAKRIAEIERGRTELRDTLDKTAGRLAGLEAELSTCVSEWLRQAGLLR